MSLVTLDRVLDFWDSSKNLKWAVNPHRVVHVDWGPVQTPPANRKDLTARRFVNVVAEDVSYTVAGTMEEVVATLNAGGRVTTTGGSAMTVRETLRMESIRIAERLLLQRSTTQGATPAQRSYTPDDVLVLADKVYRFVL